MFLQVENRFSYVQRVHTCTSSCRGRRFSCRPRQQGTAGLHKPLTPTRASAPVEPPPGPAENSFSTVQFSPVCCFQHAWVLQEQADAEGSRPTPSSWMATVPAVTDTHDSVDNAHDAECKRQSSKKLGWFFLLKVRKPVVSLLRMHEHAPPPKENSTA